MSQPTIQAFRNSWKDAFAVASATHVGMRRRNNQDNLGVFLSEDEAAWDKYGHLLIVADGMGAHAAGELASQLSVELIPHYYRKLIRGSQPEALELALTETNAEIFRKGQANPEFRSMGTTTCALTISGEGAYIGHVGDSRVYRLRGETLEQLTFDHSLVWEMRATGEITEETLRNSTIPKNVITRSLGPNGTVAVDIEGPFPLQVGDKFLLCSDGLSGQFNDAEIGLLLQVLDRESAVLAMVDLANLRGGPDNITVIVGEVLNDGIIQPSNSREAKSSPTRSTLPYPIPFGIATAVGGLLTLFLLLLGHYPIALATLFVTLVTLGVGWQKSHPTIRVGEHPPSTRGTSPYRRVQCKPNETFAENLAQVVLELEGWFSENAWTVETEGLAAMATAAKQSQTAGNYRDAIRDYTKVIMLMMQEARRHQVDPPEDSEEVDL